MTWELRQGAEKELIGAFEESRPETHAEADAAMAQQASRDKRLHSSVQDVDEFIVRFNRSSLRSRQLGRDVIGNGSHQLNLREGIARAYKST